MLYNFSDDFDVNKQIAEKNLLGWIELIENENLHKVVKSLHIQDQIFLNYIVKECRTQFDLSKIYKVDYSTIVRKNRKTSNEIRKICKQSRNFNFL